MDNEVSNVDSQGGEIRRSNDEIDRILNISLPAITQRQVSNGQDGRYCWVCFATEEEDQEAECVVDWIQPCRCRGTLKWVHQSCLQRWVDEKQKGNTFRSVNCQQCQTEYIIVLPSMGLVADIVEAVDSLIRRSSPFLAAGVFVGSLYWTAVTFGAITVLQVLGHNEGLEILESTDHIFLLVSLPAIPAFLVLGRMIRWEDYILRCIQNRQRKSFRLLSLILPIPEDEAGRQADQVVRSNISDNNISTTRVLCGALLLPSLSSLIGRVIFKNVSNNLHRALLGGLAFIAIKGALKIYFKQKLFIRKKQRRIVDYTDENIWRYQDAMGFNTE